MPQFTNAQKIEKLKAVGCASLGSACAHTVARGALATDPGGAGDARNPKPQVHYCQRYFTQTGDLRLVPFEDERYARQKHSDHLFELDAEESGRPLTAVEQARARLAQVKKEAEAEAQARAEQDEIAKLEAEAEAVERNRRGARAEQRAPGA